MSITLELSPETEAHLRADAEQQQVAIEVLAATRLDDLYRGTKSKTERKALLDSLQGSLAGTGLELEDFLLEKRADVLRQEARESV